MFRYDRLGGLALCVLGVYELALGAYMVLAPRSFFERVGPFGALNVHYVRDMASWELALGGLALVAAPRPAWRAPVLGLAALHFALHAANHLLDVDRAHPAYLGPADLVSLALGAVVLSALFVRAVRRLRRPEVPG